MSVYGIEKTIPTNNQIQTSVDNFLSPFKDIFNKTGVKVIEIIINNKTDIKFNQEIERKINCEMCL